MSDRELLEFAAKAADIGSYVGMFGDYQIPENWNPLSDDGDALRLAVKLNLHIAIECELAGAITIDWILDGGFTITGDLEQDAPVGGDDFAATRRAIVRAAAEIGKAMQG